VKTKIIYFTGGLFVGFVLSAIQANNFMAEVKRLAELEKYSPTHHSSF